MHAHLRLAVSAAVNFRNNAKSRDSVFAVKAPRGESCFTVLSVHGKIGRPRLDAMKGYGVQTKVRIQNVRSGKVSTVTLASLVDKGLSYLGKKQYLYT